MISKLNKYYIINNKKIHINILKFSFLLIKNYLLFNNIIIYKRLSVLKMHPGANNILEE